MDMPRRKRKIKKRLGGSPETKVADITLSQSADSAKQTFRHKKSSLEKSFNVKEEFLVEDDENDKEDHDTHDIDERECNVTNAAQPICKTVPQILEGKIYPFDVWEKISKKISPEDIYT